MRPPLPEVEARFESFPDFLTLGVPPKQVLDKPAAVGRSTYERREQFKANVGLALDEIPRDQAFFSPTILQSSLLTILGLEDVKCTLFGIRKISNPRRRILGNILYICTSRVGYCEIGRGPGSGLGSGFGIDRPNHLRAS